MTINYSLSDHHGTSTNVATLVADVSGRYATLMWTGAKMLGVPMKDKIVILSKSRP